jgi:ring-1,2-phenylacetyl-CoA epoxidase subunit PaaC
MQDATDDLWAFTGEMLVPTAAEIYLEQMGIIPKISEIPALWHAKIEEILHQATLQKPQGTWFQQGGKQGRHTEHLGFILAEMQFLQRAYPDSQW